MKLNTLEFWLMNNPVRAGSQRWIETPLLIGKNGALAGRRVLEVGCGRGVGMEILLSLGAAHVTGFDLDPRMVSLAQKRVARYGNRARVLVGDAEAIDAPGGSFDAVVDYGVLHHVPNWPQALKQIARVLKPGGVFFFEDVVKGFTSAWPMRTLFDHPQGTQFTAPEFRAGLEAAGLRVHRWWSFGIGSAPHRKWGIAGQAGKE